MKYFFTALLTLIVFSSFGQQTDSSKTPYLVDRKVPFFKMMMTDSSFFYKDDLKKKRPTVIIYFSPECEHCIHFTELLLERIAEFKKTQFVMISPLPLSKVKEFYIAHHIENYPNIKMGKDDLYFFGNYFQARYIPFIAAYNSKGELIRGWEGGTTINTLLEAIK